MKILSQTVTTADDTIANCVDCGLSAQRHTMTRCADCCQAVCDTCVVGDVGRCIKCASSIQETK